MITNNAPAKMILQAIVTGYKTAYIQHSIYSDYDVIGRTFWVTPAGGTTVRKDFTGVDTFYANLLGLTEGTNYSVQGAYYDAIIDSELLSAKIGINLSDIKTFKTKQAPKITKVTNVAQSVDVGVGQPMVHVETTGEADYCTIELQATTPANSPWIKYYVGALTPLIMFGGVPIGTYNIRISGQVTMPDGVSIDSSGYNVWPTSFEVKFNFEPPSAPKNLRFKTARVLDGLERYDVRLEWDWERGTGANVREFVVYWIDDVEFAKTGWTKAQVMNVGAAKAATIMSFPFNIGHTFRVSAIAWGPDKQDITYSTNAKHTITTSTPLDNSFTNETGIDVNYAYIRARMKVGTMWHQTFMVDAATGSVAIGRLGSDGRAPISFDPTNNKMNVDGTIITKDINAANVILTNLNGNQAPAIYTQGKTYGTGNVGGVWMGYDPAKAKGKLDIGNNTQYIRFDGDKLTISGQVVIGTPGGDVDLSTGIQGKFSVFVYRLATTQPAKPTTIDYPPSGWSTIPPNRVTQADKIWVVTGTLDPATNKLVSGTGWSDVVQWSGSDGAQGANGDPGKDGATGPQGPQGPAGANGAAGQRGPGFYSQGISGLTAWNASQAATFFQNAFGTGPVRFDVLTQFNSSNKTQAWTMMWNGSAWTSPALVVHGDMVVDGTIAAQHISADNAFLSRIGVNIIYNRAAALTANPETSYTMKIDLANGYIHIR